MKGLFSICVVICVAGLCCNAANPDDVASCARETKAETKELEDVVVSDGFVPSPKIRDFAACVYKKDGIMKDDGSLGKTFTEGKLAELCKIHEAGKDITETVGTLMKCFAKHDKPENSSK